MQALVIIASAALGLIVGSFLNVVIFRMNTGRGIGGRSACMSCGKQLHWHEMVPVLSYIFLRGKCSRCKSAISIQYPIVEASTALLFAGIAWRIHEPLHVAVWAIMSAVGVVIAAYDIRHRVIPLYALIAFFIASLVLGFHWLGFLLVPFPFFLLWAVSQGKWIGFGDVEIMAVIGGMFGLVSGYSAVFVSFWAACIVILPVAAYMAVKKLKRHPEIPLGPFLLAGIYAVGVLGLDVLTFVMNVVQ